MQEKVETIWASRRKRVQLRALQVRKETLRLKAEINKLQERKTLRDDFAAEALNGILSNDGIAKQSVTQDVFEVISTAAYQFADAMLKVRKRDV